MEIYQKTRETIGTAFFNLILEAVRHIFTRYEYHSGEQIIDNMEFLESDLIRIWCDCSDNFNRDLLIYQYYKKLNYMEIQLINQHYAKTNK